MPLCIMYKEVFFMISKKSIVLNGAISSMTKALLSLECDGNETQGKLRLYNFSSEPKGILTLGIYFDGKEVKAGLTQKGSMLYSFSCDIKAIPNVFSCAVVNFVGGHPSPILYGSSEGETDTDKVYDEVISRLQDTQTAKEVENLLDEYDVDYSSDVKDEIEKEIDKAVSKQDIKLCENDCENCQYKKYYFSHVKSMEVDEKKKSFLQEMTPHINNLFSQNPSEEYLEKLIPSSKFVKVSLDEENYYVLGLIYEEDVIKYICYGVPGIYQKTPPKQLSGYPFWFPLDESKKDGFGYWLSYQDAENGESIKASII